MVSQVAILPEKWLVRFTPFKGDSKSQLYFVKILEISKTVMETQLLALVREVLLLTLQLWLMNRAKLPHLVASMMVSWSTRNM